MSALKVSGYFECQGSNSLNFGPIFKILVAKYISVSRPFIWCRTPTWHVATCPQMCPKVGPWKVKITKVEKMTYQLKVSKLWVEILIYIDNLTSWAKKKISSNQCSQRAETACDSWKVPACWGLPQPLFLSFCLRDMGTLWPTMWWFWVFFWPGRMFTVVA